MSSESMVLYIDVENKKLVQSPTSDRSVGMPIFMQGDSEPLELHLLEAGMDTLYQEKTLLPENDFLQVAIARFKGYPKSLTYASGYTVKDGGGVEMVLPLNTKEIEIALQENEYISAFLEVEYSNTDGRVITVLQTACHVKNDLVENAPSVEIQEQFYDKSHVEAVFSQKAANLSDLTDKAVSRSNLDVYSKSETDAKDAESLKKTGDLSDVSNKATARTNLDVYAKNEVYSKIEADTIADKALKKSSCLFDLPDKVTSRKNLDVPKKGEISPFGLYGIYTNSSLYVGDSYSQSLGDDFSYNPTLMTLMTTYLGDGGNFRIFSSNYGDYDSLAPYLSGAGKILEIGNYYDSESGTIVYEQMTLSEAVEYGDRIAMTLEGGVLKFYKNATLIGTHALPESLHIYNPMSILEWKGLKKDFFYSNSIVLPETRSLGISSWLNYSIEDFSNGIPPPTGLFSSRFSETKNVFYRGTTANLYNMIGVGGETFSEVSNVLKLTPSQVSYSASRELRLSSNTCKSGVVNRIKFKIYLPTSNANLNRAQLRLGSSAFSTSSWQVISKTDNIDNSGYVIASDSWQEVDVTFKSRYAGQPKLYFCKNTSNYVKIEDITQDVVYVANYSIIGTQGIEGYFSGPSEASVWRNRGCSKYNFNCGSDYTSYPQEGNMFTKHFDIANFGSGIYEYMDNISGDLVLSQIVLKFSATMPNTSQESDNYNKNIFKLYLDGSLVCEEDISAFPANTPYNIFPKRGNSANIYSINTDSMYNCSCGGSMDLVFIKIK